MYTFGSAGTCSTDAANRRAFNRWKIVPAMLNDCTNRNVEVSIYERVIPLSNVFCVWLDNDPWREVPRASFHSACGCTGYLACGRRTRNCKGCRCLRDPLHYELGVIPVDRGYRKGKRAKWSAVVSALLVCLILYHHSPYHNSVANTSGRARRM
jgi:hypothetical protein